MAAPVKEAAARTLDPRVANRLQHILKLPAQELRRIAVAGKSLRSFSYFVKQAWSVIDPEPLVWGRHLDEICDTLQAHSHWALPEAAERYGWKKARKRVLVINIPPGHAKSMIVAVLWPAWLWANLASLKVLSASHAQTLALRDSVKSRTLIESDWFATHFGALPMAEDQNTKGYYRNELMGERYACSVGTGTGFRSDVQIIDDALSADDARSKVERENAKLWITETMSSRSNNAERFLRVIMGQRLHQDDPCGFLLGLPGANDDIEHLCLPSEFVKARASRTEFGGDWRTEEGELLFPQKFTQATLDAAKKPGTGMGAQAYAGQHQQNPAPAEGNIIQRAWTNNRWHLPGVQTTPDFTGKLRSLNPRTMKWDDLIIALDCSFKDKAGNDLVCAVLMGRKGPDKYLIDFRWDHMSFTATVRMMVDLIGAWPNVRRRGIEDKANGSAVIETLRQSISQIVELDPEGNSKEARVHAVTGEWEGGNVWLPYVHPKIGEAVEEMVAFPKSTHDDFTDAITYALRMLTASGDLVRLKQLATQ